MSELSRGKDYLSSRSYLSYIIKRIRRGGAWHIISELLHRARKITFISTVIRISGIIISLIEKSAILLLIFSSLAILLPALIFWGGIMLFACLTKYVKNHQKIKASLSESEKIIIFLTNSETRNSPMFLRTAAQYSENAENSVIVLCKGSFVSFSEQVNGVLKVKADYFFLLKSLYLKKYAQKTVYIALT